MRRYGRSVLIVAALGLVVWFGACSDTPCVSCPPPPPSAGFIASDPVRNPSTTVSSSDGFARSPSVGDNTVYVSLLPGTVPGGSYATVQVVGSANTLITSVFDGGFDPVPVTANVGDSIEVVVTDAGGDVVRRSGLAVAARRPPVIVRTEPPPKKRDHPLNAAIVVVFSEPVEGGSLTPSTVRLLRGGDPVAGTVTLLQGTAAAAVFTPSTPLSPNTDYQLVVTRAVRDLSGDALATGATVEFTTGTITVSPAYFVSVLPDTAALAIGSQVQVIAAARDTNGAPLAGRPVTWSSDDSAVATVSSTGLVSALTAGVARVRAHVDFAVGDGAILVTASLAPVDSVELAPASATVPVTGAVQLTPVLRDAAGNVLPFRQVSWATSNPSVATVALVSGGEGMVTGVSPGAATITATSEGKSGTASIAVASPGSYSRLVAANGHTCGLTTDGWAFCWGWNDAGQLGNGTTVGMSVPVGVSGGLKFSALTAGYGHTCALTPVGDAFCWGDNGHGQLGIGSTTGPSLMPVAVSGGLRFATISGRFGDHICGLASTGTAYCWGSNYWGQLGVGTSLTNNSIPVAVSGGLSFTALAAGLGHTCGLTSSGAAYCWGLNNTGQLGDSTTTDRTVPVRVAGGLAFVALGAGYGHTCGLVSDGTAYCWGNNSAGELGVGSMTNSSVPVKVTGGLTITTIEVGYEHTCALTASGAAYCWGENQSGALGTGSAGPEQCASNVPCSTAPVPVSGGLTFASLSAGNSHSCGVTVARLAYCWGLNFAGELGNGSKANTNVPVKVAGQP